MQTAQKKTQAAGRLERVYCTETRPYNQGARLTAFELVQDELPGTLVRRVYILLNDDVLLYSQHINMYTYTHTNHPTRQPQY